MKRQNQNHNTPIDELRLTARVDRSLVWKRGNSVRYLLAEVQAPAASVDRSGQPAALNLALVIDASGSMEGAPLAAAKQAAAGVVRQLSERDRVSLVSFDTTVTTHVEAVPVTAEGKTQALAAIAAVESGASTNLSAGWLAGATCVAHAMEGDPAGQHRVIVLSDGWANDGLTDPGVLARHAAALSQRGLYSSSVGIGDDYSTAQLRAMSSPELK